MPKFIIKIKEHYLIWSTIVDAPIIYGMTLDELTEYIKEEYGNSGLRELPARLARVNLNGTSSIQPYTPEDLVLYNRAGPNETHLSLEGVYRHYCLREPIKDEWILPEDTDEED